ncbi:hypothetical protein HYPBUDRAFT_153127 [Hyphopichia burtonii NRRL Y-1933]|uniref:Uncharacterized protein n=1 Tax=Hyphopichia burtonii NRRL Y-1933 TaxID=984485 RepID=A0A1E4RJ60_9ASCO|nr:hypothetical protein HYPBUDRAFT_153127 [Hyphopichia burtonii NRRL Y-1933]ODV67270.1 hypothetical protein HYPBUDRAFT_153127 [Hyphopichia burtonii NRRL Y-1933]
MMTSIQLDPDPLGCSKFEQNQHLLQRQHPQQRQRQNKLFTQPGESATTPIAIPSAMPIRSSPLNQKTSFKNYHLQSKNHKNPSFSSSPSPNSMSYKTSNSHSKPYQPSRRSFSTSSSLKQASINITSIKKSTRSTSSSSLLSLSKSLSPSSSFLESNSVPSTKKYSRFSDDESNYVLMKRKSSAHPLSSNDMEEEIPVYDYFYTNNSNNHNGLEFESSLSFKSPWRPKSFLTRTLSSSSTNSIESTDSEISIRSEIPLESPFASSTTSSTNTLAIPKINSKNTNDSSDSLLKVLKRNDKAPIQHSKDNLVSNLTNSLKNWKSQLINYSLSLTPRMTDDVLPLPTSTKANEVTNIETPVIDSPSTELKTYSINSNINYDDSIVRLPQFHNFKNRDERINSQFLRLYAQDFNARSTNLLPNTYTNDEFIQLYNKSEGVRNFHQNFNFYKISNMSKDKLWNSVILIPRNDPIPNGTIEYQNYIFIGDDNKFAKNSLTRLNGDYLPWSNRSSISYKPAGELPGMKPRINGLAPSSGTTKAQFTIKGWCNRRWVDCSKTDDDDDDDEIINH